MRKLVNSERAPIDHNSIFTNPIAGNRPVYPATWDNQNLNQVSSGVFTGHIFSVGLTVVQGGGKYAPPPPLLDLATVFSTEQKSKESLHCFGKFFAPLSNLIVCGYSSTNIYLGLITVLSISKCNVGSKIIARSKDINQSTTWERQLCHHDSAPRMAGPTNHPLVSRHQVTR